MSYHSDHPNPYPQLSNKLFELSPKELYFHLLEAYADPSQLPSFVG